MMSEKKRELVVIGNGMAGVATVEEILRLDPDRYNIKHIRQRAASKTITAFSWAKYSQRRKS